MGRFNSLKAKAVNPRKTRNYEGEVAYLQPNDFMRLYVDAATCTLSSNFYRKASTQEVADRIVQLAEALPHHAVANLAVYLRNEMYLRSVSCLLVAYLARNGVLDWRLATEMQLRVDDLKEIVAMYRYLNGSNSDLPKLAAQLKKFLAYGLCWMHMSDGSRKPRTAYEYRKHNKQGKEEITFLDLFRLVRPKPVDEKQQETFKQLKENTLPVAMTWETIVSAAGGGKDAWERAIEANMNYMAMLRNLRNFLKNKVSVEHFDQVLKKITDPEAIKYSMQFPYRFYSAYRELKNAYGEIGDSGRMRQALSAVEEAMRLSCGSVPGFEWLKDKRVLAAADVSSSMQEPISNMSTIQCKVLAAVMTAAFEANVPNTIIGGFGTNWVPVAPAAGMMQTIDSILNCDAGYSTNGHKIIEWALKHKEAIDVFVLFTDMQLWSQGGWNTHRSFFEAAFNKYKEQINPKARLILFNLAGYQTSPIDIVRPDVLEIAGWSDKIFQVLQSIEEGEDFFKRFYQV